MRVLVFYCVAVVTGLLSGGIGYRAMTMKVGLPGPTVTDQLLGNEVANLQLMLTQQALVVIAVGFAVVSAVFFAAAAIVQSLERASVD